MKFSIYLLSLIFLIGLSSSKDLQSTKVVNFNVRGNGKTNVSLGIGYQVGSGACCRGVSKESTVGFQGNPGDVLYDSETKRVILKVYEDLEGKTVDLRQYY
jgi:hypothetical protein